MSDEQKTGPEVITDLMQIIEINNQIIRRATFDEARAFFAQLFEGARGMEFDAQQVVLNCTFEDFTSEEPTE